MVDILTSRHERVKEEVEAEISLDYVLRRETHMEGYFKSQNSKRKGMQ